MEAENTGCSVSSMHATPRNILRQVSDEEQHNVLASNVKTELFLALSSVSVFSMGFSILHAPVEIPEMTLKCSNFAVKQ